MSPVSLIVDMCQTIGGVVMQLQNKRLQVIAFWSGKVNLAQQNYSVHEKELLAIVESMKWYRHLLLGIPFDVYTDHKPIEYLMKQKNLSVRQQRWVDVLSDFAFEIKYIPGKTDVFADVLSWIYSNEPLGIVCVMKSIIIQQSTCPYHSLFKLFTSSILRPKHVYSHQSNTYPLKSSTILLAHTTTIVVTLYSILY